jgi:hypothetical protein
MVSTSRSTAFSILAMLATHLLAAPTNTTPISSLLKRWVPEQQDRSIDWTNLPTAPPEGTIHIDSNMTTRCVNNGQPCWPYLIDTTQVCSFVVDPAMKCTGQNGTGCNVPDTLANDEFQAMRNRSMAVGDTQSMGTCSYPSRKVEVRGKWATAPVWSALGGYRLAAQRLVVADTFQSQSVFYHGYNDFVGRAKDKAFGVFGFGEWSSLVAKPLNAFSSPLMNAFLIKGGPVPHFSIAMPRGDEEGAVVIGGWPANSGSTAYVDIGIAVPSVNLTETRTKVGKGKRAPSNSTDLPAAMLNRPYVLQVDEWGYKDVEVKGSNQDQTPNAGRGRFIVDSLSPVIRTDTDHAAKVAALFEPVAVQSGGKGDLNYYVNCDAKVKSGTSISLELVGGPKSTPSKWFPIASVDLIVKMPGGKCISAFQPALEDNVMRLGWPFLKNTVVGFSFMGEGTIISVWARVAPEL